MHGNQHQLDRAHMLRDFVRNHFHIKLHPKTIQARYIRVYIAYLATRNAIFPIFFSVFFKRREVMPVMISFSLNEVMFMHSTKTYLNCITI